MESSIMRCFIFCYILSLVWLPQLSKSNDAGTLLSLKSSIDPSNSLQWKGSHFCRWRGIKRCMKGRVTKLVLEFLNLNGTLDTQILNKLNQVRVLSFKGNSISGKIRNLSNLKNLKSLYLNDNKFSGEFPASIAELHRLKIVVLSGNMISGAIPASLANLKRLNVLFLENNLLTGEIPRFNQTSLQYFNVSGNRLSGKIPETFVLLKFTSSSFSNNLDLCGQQIMIPCSKDEINASLAPSPLSFISSPFLKSNEKERNKIIVILASSSGGVVLLCIGLILSCQILRRKSAPKPHKTGDKDKDLNEGIVTETIPSQSNGGKRFTWDGEGLGSLVFCGEMNKHYGLEDLLQASAEILGRGTMWSTYKAVMESGFTVTVKRLKDSAYPGFDEFERRMVILGRLKHPNLVPVRAYFQTKKERLLVYDYFPNGSLFSLIHGLRPGGRAKPLHWTSCLKITEDIASGLVYLHQTSPGFIHGNLKSSNILLGPEFESCLTDYCLLPFFKNPDSSDEPGETSAHVFHAPECQKPCRSFTQSSDVYSFGMLLIELLTSKIPTQIHVEEHLADIQNWVRSIRNQARVSGEDSSSDEEKLGALMRIAASCLSVNPESRPKMKDVLGMVTDVRSESHISSHSGDW